MRIAWLSCGGDMSIATLRPLPITLRRVRIAGSEALGVAFGMAIGERGSITGGESGLDWTSSCKGKEKSRNGGKHGQQSRLGGTLGQIG